MSLTQRQLEIRRSGLTAGDMRAVVDEDPHGRTPHDVFVSKFFPEADNFKENNEAIRLGHELEPIALRIGSEKVGLHVMRRDPELLTVRHRERSAHIATPDAFLSEHAFVEAIALAEAKAVGLHNAWQWGEGGEEIPDWCLVQVTWQAYVAAIPIVYVFALIGTEVRTFRIEQNAELTGVLVDEADRFLRDHITPRRPPPVDGSSGSRRMLKQLFKRADGPVIRATPEVESLARQYLDAKRAAAQDSQRIAELEDHLMLECGDNCSIVGEGWRLRYELRKEYSVTPKPYVVPARRVFDLREVKSGLAGVLGRKGRGERKEVA